MHTHAVMAGQKVERVGICILRIWASPVLRLSILPQGSAIFTAADLPLLASGAAWSGLYERSSASWDLQSGLVAPLATAQGLMTLRDTIAAVKQAPVSVIRRSRLDLNGRV